MSGLDTTDLVLIAVAYFSSVLSGIAGAGGGTILIGAIYAAGMPPVVAVPLHAAVQLASNASRVVAYLPNVRWSAAIVFCIGALPAPFLVAPLVAKVNPDWVRLGMAVFIVWTLWPRKKAPVPWSDRTAMGVAGVLNGGVGAVVGATGLLIGPLFLRPGWPKESTIGTLALCQALGHAFKVAAFATVGFVVVQQLGLLIGMIAGVILGTTTGRVLHRHLSEAAFRPVFKGILAILAAKLLWDVAGRLVFA